MGTPEGPARGLGTALHPSTVRTTSERERIEALWAQVAGDTRFRSTRFYLKGRRAAGDRRRFCEGFRYNPLRSMTFHLG
jgi:hypothetical protein